MSYSDSASSLLGGLNVRVFLFVPAIALMFALPGKFEFGAKNASQPEKIFVFRGNIVQATTVSTDRLGRP